MNRSRFFITLFLIISYFMPNPVYAVSNDYGGIFNLSVSKKFGKRVNLQIQESLWINENFSDYERNMPSACITVSLWKEYLKANARYCYLNQKNLKNEIKNRHRYQIGLLTGYKWEHFSASLNSRFESTYTHHVNIPNNRWRNLVTFNYTISQKCRWKPVIDIEFFNFLNNPKGNGLERIWYEAGVEFSIDKKNAVEFKLREEQMIKSSPKQANMFLNFSYKIKL